MTTDCINLKQMFGDRFKVAYEESYQADYGEGATREYPWYLQISCQHGHISPWDGTRLAACTSTNSQIATRLRKLPFLDREATQDGDDGINAVFDMEHFEEVARIIKPRKRRRLPEGQRQAAAERLRKYQFVKGQAGHGHARQAEKSAQECDPSTYPA
jgi:hypothetical protein